MVGELAAAPDLNGWTIVERLIEDSAQATRERIWLVIDDLHELRSDEATRQLKSFVKCASPEVQFVLSTRCDPHLGLHRLRVDGELTEIRTPDLRFTPTEARALFEAAGVQLSGMALNRLLRRTEGWVGGLRLAAMSLGNHDDPEQFAGEFSGSERTVAAYLLAEVLERQPAEVRELLLYTSLLECVSGPLGRPPHGELGRRGDLAQAGGLRRVCELGRCGSLLVPLPPPVCRPVAAGAPADVSRDRWVSCIGRPPTGSSRRATRSRRSATHR